MALLAPPNYLTLSAMITPALFMTANGSLIISTSNRMSRIVDRMRVLNDQADTLSRGATDLDFAAERQAHIDAELKRLRWRADRIRNALTLLYLAFSAFVGTSLTLALDVLLSNRLVAVPTGLAIIGVTLMLAASANMVREARAALRGNRQEVAFYQKLQKLREPGASRAEPS